MAVTNMKQQFDCFVLMISEMRFFIAVLYSCTVCGIFNYMFIFSLVRALSCMLSA
jgi:hypothetical protein